LCEFLGREVPPGTPFPHLNEGKETLERLARDRLFGPWIRGAQIALAAGSLMLLLWWLLG
jgi:hypothetical protein